MQIQFLSLMIENFKKPPAYLKLPQRRGTFFAPLEPRRGPPLRTIPQLLRHFTIALNAAPIGARTLSACSTEPGPESSP